MTSKEQAMHWRNLAKKYHSFGFNIVPLGSDKRPVTTGVSSSGAPLRFKWSDWIETRQDDKLFAGVLGFAWWADVRGVAALGGPVSGNLLIFDGDHADIEVARQNLRLLGLPEGYEWLNPSGSGDGWHLYVKCSGWTQATASVRHEAVGGGVLETRWGGSHTALPGSCHPSGSIYPGEPAMPPREVAAAAAAEFLAAVTVATPRPAPRPAARPAADARQKYVDAALRSETAAVARAANGGRNAQLNRSAFALGTLVGAGALARHDAETELTAAALAAGLEQAEIAATLRSGIDAGQAAPRDMSDVAQEQPAAGGAAIGERNTWPYAVVDGRIVFQFENKDGIGHRPIADFTARIVEESRIAETTDVVYTLSGVGKRCGFFTCQIAGADFLSPAKLQAAITQAAGPYDAVNPDLSKRLPAAIQTLTEDVAKTLTWRRMGWANGRFLIAGNLPSGVKLELPTKLAYGVDPDGDLDQAVDALRYFLRAVTPARGTIILSHLLAAPMAAAAGWRGERSSLAIIGRTGSLKTSAAMLAMCLYGAAFQSEDALLTWGQGATVNAVLELASAAGDLPLLIDNFKPNTGNGVRDFVDVMHAISEGTTKARVSRGGELRPSKAIHCWPLITGEDVPARDAASLARTLLLDWPENGVDKALLTHAQRLAHHLPALGAAWLHWLESADGQRIAAEAGGALASKRTNWGAYLAGTRSDIANPLRVATNLATHEIAWLTATQFAPLATLAKDLVPAMMDGLRSCAGSMATLTADTREVSRFLNGLREGLAAGALLLGTEIDKANGGFPPQQADRYVGWDAKAFGKDGAFIFPERVRHAVSRFIDDDFGGISQRALGDQLKAGDWLVRTDDKTGYTAILVKINDKPIRVWHVKPGALIHAAREQDELAEVGV